MDETFFSVLRIHRVSNTLKPIFQKTESKKKSSTYLPQISIHYENSNILYKKSLAPIKVVKLLDKRPDLRLRKKSRYNSITISGSPLELRMRYLTPEPTRKLGYIAKVPNIKYDH